MVAHVYDITYGSVARGKDNLVVIDDSIVRGTTLKQSILKILDRLGPKKIIIVSSAPQIRYPDCYGIDMAKMGDFIAFQAVVELLRGELSAGFASTSVSQVQGTGIVTEGAYQKLCQGIVRTIYVRTGFCKNCSIVNSSGYSGRSRDCLPNRRRFT
jgi:glutamine phosphoribosylpyrophosphate amidotransferase